MHHASSGRDVTSPSHPSEFRYFANVDKPGVRALRRVAQLALGYDPRPSDELARIFGASYYDADPLAEAFVDEVYLTRGRDVGREMLDRAITEGVANMADAPASLCALFEDLDNAPAWVDFERVAAGAAVFRRYGTDVFHFGGAITLSAYSECSVAKPLVLTGGYAGSRTLERFLETASFWIDVSEPGGLDRGNRGFAAALRVRIMHVFVRRRLLQHPEWDLEAWGVPISQADASLTLMGGSFAPGVALHAMGYRTSAREIEALMHFWRYVGHLMGVRPRLYPTSIREAVQLSFVAAVKSAHRAGDDGRHLCHSYVNAYAAPESGSWRDRARTTLYDGVHRGYTRFFMPPWDYRHNGLPGARLWTLYPLAQFPFIFAAETLRRAFPSLEQVADRVASRSRRRWLTARMGAKHAKYQPVERFTR